MRIRVTVVTVTYGSRWHYLQQVLTTVFNQGVEYAVVVDNASVDNIENSVREVFGTKVKVISLSTNTGSANGFKVGIEEALKIGSELLWLLDDDNKPDSSALDNLLEGYMHLQIDFSKDNFAVLSFRCDHQTDIAVGTPLTRCYPRPGSFFGFHLLDVPYKIWRRTPWGRPPKTVVLPSLISIPYAPYSGFFFHRSLIDRIGLPDTRFVLYADDTDFTSRIVSLGGKIFLITDSVIEDLEKSWNTKSQFSSSFRGWLCGSGDLRAYYGARNQSYIEYNRTSKSFIRSINRVVYLSLLIVVAIFIRRLPRLRLLLEAIHAGEIGELGLDKRFSLP